jgi:DinB superfamily
MTINLYAVAAEFYQRYLDLVKEKNVVAALRKSTRQFKKLLDQVPAKKTNYAYAPGKWTLKEVLQHVIDTERVFAYRALCFARKDGTPLPSFDENQWAAQAQASTRKWKDLVEEFKAQRKSTELLFASFHDDQLLFLGTASGNPINTLALGLLCAGHLAHHMKLIKEKYLVP